ncbi:cytochrome c6 [bacterium BMS3Bbin12]|nr:cytochrome c6 [bacterium BMS3Abin12]GBE47421.1 cytochrome c6 [bacterium BMS3Bbin12]GBE51101.1 cytochrome c6 [bacterium BMS3Bbin13]
MKSLKVAIIASSLVFPGLAVPVFASTAQFPKMPKINTSKYPKGELGRMVRLGENIMNNTYKNPLTKDMVGNKLNCRSCHLAGSDGKPGTAKGIGTFIGTAAAFPAYSKREKTVQTLQDRINNCFMRSMNGKRPIIDTKASVAMAAYITWLSQGLPMKMNEKRPCGLYNSNRWAKSVKKFAKIQRKATHQNYLAGKEIFANKCAACHGVNGQGVGSFPPLWGKTSKGEWLSYNTGSGMSKLNKGAAWAQSNMPLGQGGTLTDQESADVMLYVDAQPRADFDLQKGLFPRDKMGYYNSNVLKEHHSVKSNFKAFGLDLDKIRGTAK